MLIALPNVDGSFTVTLFLPQHGAESFATLDSRDAVDAFFARHFPDVVPLMPELAREFLENPVGRMGTVLRERWAAPGGHAVLLGDAAHAIVPFHGQGMNACFEDCCELNRLLEATGDWAQRVRVVRGSCASRNTDAIAAMALENYVEMRDTVRDPKFMLRKELVVRARAPLPGPLHPALLDGDVSPRDPLRGRVRARAHPGPHPRGCNERSTRSSTSTGRDRGWVRERLAPLRRPAGLSAVHRAWRRTRRETRR